ncbi:MAG: AAA family ATPase [Candidatus Obscuribacterales bacterium]|nr:AAA family ATPase [Candidatus Obscuribacterales bacterium]
MILNSISLHNFMSYADAKLDLTSLAVACLSGPNGAGKSALLDAVTWALWESARSGSEELIRLGQNEMWVDVSFELEGQIYRVRRSRQKSYGKSGRKTGSKGHLDFQVWQKDRDEWLSLTASTMRQTQDSLANVLKMDYATFVSSVYFRQGRADEFTLRSAGERKQVLSDILGLDYFEKLQELAKQEVKERRGRIQAYEAALSSASGLEQGLQDSLSELAELTTDYEAAVRDLSEHLARAADCRNELSELRYGQLQLQADSTRLEDVKKELTTLSERLVQLQQQAEVKSAVVNRQEEIKIQFTRFEELKKQSEILDEAALAVHDLANQRLELKSKIATAQGRLEVELEHLLEQVRANKERQQTLVKSLKNKDKLEEEFQSYRLLMARELDLSKRRESFIQFSARVEELQSGIAEARVRLDEEIQQKQSLLEELKKLMNSKEHILVEKNELNDKLVELERLELQFEHVEEKGLKAKSQLANNEQQIQQLKRHLYENSEKVRELTADTHLTNCPLCRSPIVDGAAVLDRYRLDSENINQEIAALEAEKSVLAEQRESLRQEYVSLRHKLESRKVIDMRIGEFNEKEAALSRAQDNHDQLTREIELCRQRLVDQDFAQVEKESFIRIKAEIAKLDFDPIIYTSLQSQIRAQRHVEFRYQQLEADSRELSVLEKETLRQEERVNTLKDQLENQTYETEARQSLKELEAKIGEYNYDRVLHQSVRQQLLALLPSAEAAKELEAASYELPILNKEIVQLQESFASRHSEEERLESSIAGLNRKLDRQEDLAAELSHRQELSLQAEAAEAELLKRKIALEAKLEHLHLGKSDLDSKKNLLAVTVKEMHEFSTLVEILGKKGLPAIIIENAIPEIESEANRILSRLSENQMHIALATQNRNRQGQPVETLDIMIADELGTRNYELYSGGEAFKVNFALRLALSRLLARRVGAKLETLIIDEGFGSQDEPSRERMIRAIDSIKREFARILVITHIADVKEMFPVQILVNKAEGLSQLSLSV